MKITQTLSPLDPLLSPCLATQDLAELQSGNIDAAIRSAERGALTPCSLCRDVPRNHRQRDGRQAEKARHWAEFVFARRPDANVSESFRALPFEDWQFRRDVAGKR